MAASTESLTPRRRAIREPSEAGPVTIAVFEDTCGNLIQIVQL